MSSKTKRPLLKSPLGNSNLRHSPLLPVQQPSPPALSPNRKGFHLSYKRTVFLFVAISSALLLLNTVNTHFTIRSSLTTDNGSGNPRETLTIPGVIEPPLLHDYDYESNPHENLQEQPDEHPHPYNEAEDDDEENDDEEWRFSDDALGEDEDEDEDEEENDTQVHSPHDRARPPTRSQPRIIEGIIPASCPRLFLSTETSFDPPSYASSSTTPPFSLHSAALKPSEVTCQPIPSQLQDYTLAFCISTTDCSRGFIQIVHDMTEANPMPRFRVSRNATHDQYFREVAGPDDFYFVLEGAQKLALSAHLVEGDLLVNTGNSNASSSSLNRLVYRADFHMTLPGPVQVSGWLTYERYRAVRENRSGIWPQWTHLMLIDPTTVIDSTDKTSTSTKPSVVAASATKFTICPSCQLEPFLEQLRVYRERRFEQCDRMAPARGSYWKEELALKIYSELDIINRAPGAGAFHKADEADTGNKTSTDGIKEQEQEEDGNTRLTRGWRFVPNGCTMTKTSGQPNASSQAPFQSSCDSIASSAAMMRPSRSESSASVDAEDSHDQQTEKSPEYPRRRILFTGDSQVRATYNAILNHYRPIDPKHQRFSNHDEFLPGLADLYNDSSVTSTPTGATTITRSASDTEIELVYKADQFLDFLVTSTDQELDLYDTIYINIGQWPASGPVAGGQWSTAKLLGRWEAAVERLNRWRQSREERSLARSLYSEEMATKKDPTVGSGASSRVIWAGMNAFPMRTDPTIRVKGDWRTNARLGYWDDWIENMAQEDGGWFRRINAWQLTFPMLDQVVDKAHFQETDAIDALKIEALYKLDLCSRMSPDTPYTSEPSTVTSTTMAAAASS
ncbi:hypothetical protein BGZ68_001552 [Mortierella alpina]|nr:hypothetical protein BGZ68_001552 [Mortierella alpina]